MEVPGMYKFQGQIICIQLLRKLLDNEHNLSETRKRRPELKEKSKN